MKDDAAGDGLNKEVKCGLGDHIARQRIDPYILMLNGIRHIEAHLKRCLGLDIKEDYDEEHDDYYENEYTRTEQQDVDAIVKALRKVLGCTHNELFAEVKSNPFGTGTPWNDVEKFRADNANYVRTYLSEEMSKPNEANLPDPSLFCTHPQA